MVLDTLENLEKYASLNPLFADVIDFLKKTNIAEHEQGKVVLKENMLSVNFSKTSGKKENEARLETHDKMIDIQIPLNCTEIMGYTPRTNLQASTYDKVKDISFYDGPAEQYIKVKPGMFAIFFPEDGHAPCISDEKEIKKVIFKVLA